MVPGDAYGAPEPSVSHQNNRGALVTKDQVLAALKAKGFVPDSEKPIQYGVQLRFTNGSLVSVFDSGAITPQGKDVELVKQILGLEPGKNGGAVAQPLVQPKGPINNKVFVVYGHDEQARARLDAMLRRWGLEPLILDQLPSEGQTIIEKLEKYTGEAKFGVVLATPDDEGFRRNHPDEKALRARQNVVLELGMLLSTLNRPGFCRQSRASYFLSNRSPYEQSTLPRRIQDRGGQTNP